MATQRDGMGAPGTAPPRGWEGFGRSYGAALVVAAVVTVASTASLLRSESNGAGAPREVVAAAQSAADGEGAARGGATVAPRAAVGASAPDGADAAAAGVVQGARPYDFNGDGFGDLAVGAPGTYLGTVNVLYGGDQGVSARDDQLLTQDTPGMQGQDLWGLYGRFGFALASADFDRDGYADLVVSAPSAHTAEPYSAPDGVVHVLYGTPTGLSTDRDQLWWQGADGIRANRNVGGDYFGGAVAAGDFDGDGFADLAVGAPDVSVDGNRNAGEVYVIRGSALGLTGVGSQAWNQDSAGVSGAAARPAYTGYIEQNFGDALAAGDVDNDGYAELVIGVPGERVHGSCTDPERLCSKKAYGAGAVHVLFGGAAGLTSEREEFFHQNTKGVLGTAWTKAEFPMDAEALGKAVAIGDFNNDGFGDVVAGAPWDDIKRNVPVCDDPQPPPKPLLWPPGGVCGAGAVNVLYGTSSGLTTAGDDYWHLDARGVNGEYGGSFGAAIAAGDVDRDGDDDLAIGIPRMTVSSHRWAGAVLVLRGRAGGLHEDDDKLWTLNTPGVRGRASQTAWFGQDVAIRQMGRSRASELVVGAPRERLDNYGYAGRVSVLYGSARGPSTDSDQLWSKLTPGVKGTPGVDRQPEGEPTLHDEFGTL